MYSREELAFQKRYAFASLIRNGITTALPIASLFYRAWGETWRNSKMPPRPRPNSACAFISARPIAPATRWSQRMAPSARIMTSRVGWPKLEAAIDFAQRIEGEAGGLIRAMLAPDRIETCTPELLRRSAAAARDLDIPIRQHCCQSKIEYDLVLAQHGMSPPEWMASLGYLSERSPAAAWHLCLGLALHCPTGPGS